MSGSEVEMTSTSVLSIKDVVTSYLFWDVETVKLNTYKPYLIIKTVEHTRGRLVTFKPSPGILVGLQPFHVEECWTPCFFGRLIESTDVKMTVLQEGNELYNTMPPMVTLYFVRTFFAARLLNGP